VGKEDTDAKLDRLIDALLASAAAVGGAPGGAIDVQKLAVAIVAAQDAAAKAPGRNVLDEQVEQLQQMRSRPGGKLGYAYRFTSKITGASFTVVVQESRKSKLGRITELTEYRLPDGWMQTLLKQNPQLNDIKDLSEKSPEIRELMYATWYKPDLRYYVGALVGEHDAGNPNPVRFDEDHWVALPVVWPDDPEYATVVDLVAEDRKASRAA
jgi:hypothetical protein